MKRLNASLMSDGPIHGKNDKTARSMRSVPKPIQKCINSEAEQDEGRKTDKMLKHIKRKLGTEVNWHQYYKRVANKNRRNQWVVHLGS